ncbi:MAG TPA: pyridoxal phosphate-dependent aminotransferase [Nitrospirae bacterium]|nr:aspartate aminotransferase [bacterium BMS3Abin06]HDH10640.1 pyridoxal phosphate-dependent aminotransferase [Nitrospirota bacterium]HDZ02347.1 pyridoxal phosphate-dependent aminotransferase [Nitrospirota bacterium]
MRLAERTKAIKPSPTLSMNAKAKALKAAGEDIINFGVGEPDFDTPENIKDAAIKAIREGFTKYTPVGGIDDLKSAIIEKFKNDNNLDYEKENILVSCGAKHSLYNIAEALFGPGDEVIIPAPYWVTYPDQVLLNDAVPVIVETGEEKSFMIEPDILREKLTGKTKALILNSPSNPTGLAYDKESLEKIAEIAVEHDFYIISDEIYEKLVYEGFRHVSIASLGEEIKQRTVVVNGLSKSHSMTGWRIGFTAGPRDITKAMTNIQSQSTSNAVSISQKAAVEALTGPQDFIRKMLSEFDKRRKYMVARLNAMNGVSCKTPVGAFYAFPNVSAHFGKKFNDTQVNNSLELSTYFLEQAKVALVPGSAFGDDRYIRLSYATSMDNIKKGLDRIEEALGKLE